jgi:outer membrane immunogenic protein
MKTKIIVAIAMLFGLCGFASAQPAFFAASGVNSTNPSGWVGGGQAGYNWQNGSLVYGLEADIAALGLRSTMNTTLIGNIPIPAFATTTSNIDWYGTVRGRLGWATGPVMIYGTGGLAYGRTGLNSTLVDPFFGIALNTQSSSVKTGWVLGAGLDYLVRPNLILNFSYQYIDLGRTNLYGIVAPNQILSQNLYGRDQFQVATIGLSWLFAPSAPAAVGRMYTKAPLAPVVTSPWQGIYVGGRVGGAKGNKTDAQYSDDPGATF